MLQKAEMVAKKAIESLYDCTCSVIEYQEVIKTNKSTGFEEVIVLENKPCRLSYENISVVNSDENNATEKVIITKLFISPDVDIKPGSKISVTKNDITKDYKSSGEPAKYNTHQEIMLELFERWS